MSAAHTLGPMSMSSDDTDVTQPIPTTAKVATRLPAQDLDRARTWYRDKLGLEPSETRDGGVLYRMGNGEFALFESAGAPSGDHTQMGFEVEDIQVTVAELKARGVEFDAAGVVEIEGNYPSKGRGEFGAWFRDSEGNVLGLGQPIV
jgi:catechol 2,3-dioxygenase-like lactoylglutathione lyase family enzyme